MSSKKCTWVTFLVDCYRGLYSPPSKNTILGRCQPLRPCSRRIPEKSAVPPPRRMAQRGGFPHFFFRFRRLHGLSGWYLTEKLVKTGGTPFLSAFWPFCANWPKPVHSWGTLGVQGIEEKRNLPLGGEPRGHPESLFCTYCVSGAQIHPPGDL